MTFWFIRQEYESDFEGQRWDTLLEAWLRLIPASGRFKPVYGTVMALQDLTARDHVESDPLNLDHLSTRGG